MDVIDGKVVHGKCWHVDNVLNDALLCIMLTSLVGRTGNGADGRSLFGEVVTLSRAGRLLNFDVGKKWKCYEHDCGPKVAVFCCV